MEDRIIALKDVYILIPRICEYLPYMAKQLCRYDYVKNLEIDY